MRIAILGTVGVPGCYGGFETLAEQLVRYDQCENTCHELLVYCEEAAYPERPKKFLSAELVYLPVKANGAQSLLYDFWSLISACRRKVDAVLLLGVSGALLLPFIRLFSRTKIVTNIDGIEWKREKWSMPARFLLRISEWAAVRFSHAVVADNQAVSNYIQQTYDVNSTTIFYGGDHASEITASHTECLPAIPESYALALCRIEPENNPETILEAFADYGNKNLVFIGNWDRSNYGRSLRERFNNTKNLFLLDPVYDIAKLKSLREGANLYIHGHSAGGTNPSLVEMMHFMVPIIAYDCEFNRFTTENSAQYFSSPENLRRILENMEAGEMVDMGRVMLAIAKRKYTWDRVGQQYFKLIENI